MRQPKLKRKELIRPKTPAQHALFLQHVSADAIDNPSPSSDIQMELDLFYTNALDF